MRLHLSLSKNTSVIPFNYQNLLTGCIHKWIGKDNGQHGLISLYSFSWLHRVNTTKNGIWLRPDSYFFLSFYESGLTKKVVSGILNDPEMFHGTRVVHVSMSETPVFRDAQRFLAASPILIKRAVEGKGEMHFTFLDAESAPFMTQTLQTKLKKAGLAHEGVAVKFDGSYRKPKTKIITYGNTRNKVNQCPIIVKGSPEQLAFAYHVGIGNSTGIGFGALT